MKISVAIITYNEELNINRCLDAAMRVSDDIIVLDSNSTDQTKLLASNKGANVFNHDFEGFGEQKNIAAEKTKYDWVLSLDADEVLSNELINSINNLNCDNDTTVFALNRLTNYCGKWIKHGGWYPDRKIRLWNKKRAKWEGSIHEKPVIPNNSIIISLKGDLLHYSYTRIEEHIRQGDKFSRLNAEKLFDKNKNTNIFQMMFAPCFKFCKMYFLKLGFLDGYYGFIIAKLSAHATFLKHLRLLQMKGF